MSRLVKDWTNKEIGSMIAKQCELNIYGKGVSELNLEQNDESKRPINGELVRSAVKMEDIAKEIYNMLN